MNAASSLPRVTLAPGAREAAPSQVKGAHRAQVRGCGARPTGTYSVPYAAGVHKGRDEQVRRGVVEAPGGRGTRSEGVWATTSNTTETVADRRLALWACTTVTFHREFSQFQPRGGSRASADFRTARASSEVPDVGPLHSDSSHRHACHS